MITFGRMTTLAAAAVLAAGMWGMSPAAAATTTDCPGPADTDDEYAREFTLTTEDPISNSCYAWGPNNDANDDAFNDKRLADFGIEHVLLSKIEFDDDVLQKSGTDPSLLDDLIDLLGGNGGSFSLDATGFENVLLVFKTGTGGSTPGFAAFLLDPAGPTEGAWSVTLRQTLSHVSLYGNPAPIPLPAAGFLLLGALGGLGVMARRRRRAA